MTRRFWPLVGLLIGCLGDPSPDRAPSSDASERLAPLTAATTTEGRVGAVAPSSGVSPTASTSASPSAPSASAPNQWEAAYPGITSIANRQERQEVTTVLDRIEKGGPFPFEKDGVTFQNRERRLPSHPRGYYREFTVKTPEVSHRGARRIVRGDHEETYYTRDHYETFIDLRKEPER